MSCSNCNKAANTDFEETYECRFCKFEHAKAIPRANALIRLEDRSGELDAGVIGEIAEALLEAKANDIMNEFLKDSNTNNVIKTESKEDLIFYLKVTQKRQDSPEFRYEIIFIFNASGANTCINSSTAITDMDCSTEISEVNISTGDNSQDTTGKNKMFSAEVSTNITPETPNAKRSLFKILALQQKTSFATLKWQHSINECC